jgi:hypothetical protein
MNYIPKPGDKVFIVDGPGFPPLPGIIRGVIEDMFEETLYSVNIVGGCIIFRNNSKLVLIPKHASKNQVKALERLLDERE